MESVPFADRSSGVRGASLLSGLSELAARVQRQRTVDTVLGTAGDGILALGMRLCAFQIDGADLVLRSVATRPSRISALEERIGRPLRGLRVPLAGCELVEEVVAGERLAYRKNLDVFDRMVRVATGFDPSVLDAARETAGIANGLLAPVFVRQAPWGVVEVVSASLGREDAAAIGLFAMHLGAALEVVEVIEALERANREIAEAQATLVKRERLAALGELAAMMAHEVRNPVGVLFNVIASLRASSTGTPRPAADTDLLLGIAAEEADRLNRIVSDLLDFARPAPPDPTPCRLGDLLESAARVVGGRIDLDVAADLPLVRVDARCFHRALVNLLMNGLQAMADEDPVLTVRARQEEREGVPCARIDVVDRGPGIPDDLRDAIFEPFFTTKASGTGLGLAIVKRIVDSHRGFLSATSIAGKTTFTVHLPLD